MTHRFSTPLLVLLLGLGVCAPPALGSSSLWLHERAAGEGTEFSKIWEYKPALVTTVHSRDGQVMGYLFREKRFLVGIDAMTPYLVKAFLAAEDSSFYEHEGIDLTAIFRALSKNISAGDIVQGASTITQQVVKRILLTSEKSYARKIKEAILSYRLEHQMSKNEILTIYLNEIFLGANAYGVEAAARTYFGKHALDLNLAEAALLAGLPKAPTRYNPYRYPQAAKARQAYVLGRMLELNWITQEEHDQALEYELIYKSMPDPSWGLGAYYLEEVRRWLVDNMATLVTDPSKTWGRSGEDAVYEAGLEIFTAMDTEHQRLAELALRDGLEASSRRRGWLGPVRHLDPGAFDVFLNANTLPPDAAVGDWFKVLVTKVETGGATVRIGARTGFIDVKSMHWCRTPNPKVATEQVASIKDAHKVVKPGDVVWAALDAEPLEDKPLALSLRQRPKVQGALISMEPPKGDVVALVGGYDFKLSQFNRATQAVRQPGSAFKPIVYSAALDAGFSPASVVMDEPFVHVDPITKKVWEPKNYSGSFYGPTMLCTALAKSRNLVTIRVAALMGIQRLLDRSRAMGLKGDFGPYLPVALGSVAVTPINLCQAYTAFARDGSYIEPRLVLSIRNQQNQEIFSSTPKAHQAISPQNAYVMSSMLKEVIRRGTAGSAKVINRPLAGKTGTTNEERDAWFIGFSPYLLTGVYVGFDQIEPMGSKETGSRAALPIWIQYRQGVESFYHEQDFTRPDGIIFQHVASSGFAAEEERSGEYYLPFIASNFGEPMFMDGYFTEFGQDFVLDGSYQGAFPYYEGGSGSSGHEPSTSQEEYLLKQLF